MGLRKTCLEAESDCGLGSKRSTCFEMRGLSPRLDPAIDSMAVPFGRRQGGEPKHLERYTGGLQFDLDCHHIVSTERGEEGTVTMSKKKTNHDSWVIAMSFLTISVVAFAQPTTSQPTTSQGKTSNITKPASVPQPISSAQAIYLVRSTLMMLNDANRSGNYTVLRDLAAPEFQTRNSAADLALSFLDLRRRKFDLFAVSFSDPHFSPAPAVDANGKVHLAGVFPTRPLQIKFDLTFESVDGEWKLFAISVATPEAPKQQSSLPPPSSSSQHPGGLFYNFRLFSGTAGWRW